MTSKLKTNSSFEKRFHEKLVILSYIFVSRLTRFRLLIPLNRTPPFNSSLGLNQFLTTVIQEIKCRVLCTIQTVSPFHFRYFSDSMSIGQKLLPFFVPLNDFTGSTNILPIYYYLCNVGIRERERGGGYVPLPLSNCQFLSFHVLNRIYTSY